MKPQQKPQMAATSGQTRWANLGLLQVMKMNRDNQTWLTSRNESKIIRYTVNSYRWYTARNRAVQHTVRGPVQIADILMNTCKTTSWALAIPSACSSLKISSGFISNHMIMELMNKELEQLVKQVTDMICTGLSVSKYTEPVDKMYITNSYK